jgi:hypothetical protein
MSKRLLILCALVAPIYAWAQHPRILFNSSEIPGIVANINDKQACNDLYSEVVSLSTRFNNHYLWHLDEYPHNKAVYYHGVLAVAFQYLVTGDVQFANRAKFLIFNQDLDFIKQGILYDDWYARFPNPNEDNWGGARLRAISQQVAFLSLLYDWLYDQLNAGQRLQIQNKVIANLNFIIIMNQLIHIMWYPFFSTNR